MTRPVRGFSARKKGSIVSRSAANVYGGAGGVADRAEPGQQRLERPRPVVLGAEQQPDQVPDLTVHDSPWGRFGADR
ncbi:MAG: hypothetical protein ACLQDY_07410 [Streptosporangiaceae bacterium]